MKIFKTIIWILAIAFNLLLILSCKKNNTQPNNVNIIPVDTTTYVNLTVTAFKGHPIEYYKDAEIRIDESYTKVKNKLGNYQYVVFTDSLGTVVTKVKLRKYYIMVYPKGLSGKLDSIITKTNFNNYLQFNW